AGQVGDPWAERLAQALQQRELLAALDAQAERSADEAIERLQLLRRLEPGQDLRAELATFNTEYADHALGLYLQADALLDRGDAAGLPLLERVCALDPEAIKPACQRAYGFLIEQRQREQAEPYVERWRARDELETLRAQQRKNFDGKDRFTSHGLPAETVAQITALLSGPARQHVTEAWLARRVIPADDSSKQWVIGLRLGWWARRRGKQAEVVQRLANLEWPVPLIFVTLDGRFAPWLKKLRTLAGARLA
ncbi:MAG: hypothetical protein CFE45_42815, partial [Burkholderiales bacterium PBB5]